MDLLPGEVVPGSLEDLPLSLLQQLLMLAAVLGFVVQAGCCWGHAPLGPFWLNWGDKLGQPSLGAREDQPGCSQHALTTIHQALSLTVKCPWETYSVHVALV